MSNLIVAVIGVAFASALMLAGVNYLSPTHSIVATTAGQSVGDIEEITADYNNLAVNLGRRPTVSDYQAVYNGQSQSAIYTTTGGAVAKAATLPGNNGGWVFTPNCGGGAGTPDCFVLTMDGTGLSGGPTSAAANLSFAAVQQAALKEMNSGQASRLAMAPAGTALTSANANPAGWQMPASGKYALVVQLASNSVTDVSCTPCIDGNGASHACDTAWPGSPTSSQQACPNPYGGTETVTTTAQYQCLNQGGTGQIQTNTSQPNTDQSGCVQILNIQPNACSTSCGTGTQSYSWSCYNAYGVQVAQADCQAAGLAAPASQTCTDYDGCAAACGSDSGAPVASLALGGPNACGTGNTYAPAAYDTTRYAWNWTCTTEYGQSIGCSEAQSMPGTCATAVDTCAPGSLYSAVSQPIDFTNDKYDWSCTGVNQGTTVTCTAPAPVTCGSAGGSSYSSSPLNSGDPGYGDLCNVGGQDTSIGVTSTGYDSTNYAWTWTCQGGASCSAKQKMAGTCGVGTYSCANGSQVDVGSEGMNTSSYMYVWTCTGDNGGSTANCSSPAPQAGVCGTALNTCQPGSVAGGGAYDSANFQDVWFCQGINGGSTANCAIPVPQTGACGTALNTCQPGSVAGGGAYDAANFQDVWFCQGINGGSTANCALPDNSRATFGWYPVNIVCTPGCGQSATEDQGGWICIRTNDGATVDNSLCQAALGNPTLSFWLTSQAANGASATCTDYSQCTGSCGPALNTCQPGSVAGNGAYDAANFQDVWTCTAQNGSTANCAIPVPQTGACGTALNTCQPGSVAGGGAYDAANFQDVWFCQGINGGSTANCALPDNSRATFGWYPVNIVCTPGCGQSATEDQGGWICIRTNDGATVDNSLCQAALGNPTLSFWLTSQAANGASATCTDYSQCTGSCGPALNTCQPGSVAGNGAYDAANFQDVWTCTAQNGSTANCAIPVPQTGACGTALNTCQPGSVAGGGAYDAANFQDVWFCQGVNGGSTANCAIPDYSRATYTLTNVTYGNCTPACGASTQALTGYTCTRSDGTVVENSYCTAPAATQACTDNSQCTACGSDNGGNFSANNPPWNSNRSNLCIIGGVSTDAGSGNPTYDGVHFGYTCSTSASSVQCQANVITVGPVNGQTVSSSPFSGSLSNQLCMVGGVPTSQYAENENFNGTTFTYDCAGVSGAVTATVYCGNAEGSLPSAAPWTTSLAGQLCSIAGEQTQSQSANGAVGPSGTWTWTCGSSQCSTNSIGCGTDNGGFYTAWPDSVTPGHLCNYNGSETDSGYHDGGWYNGSFGWYCGSQYCSANYATYNWWPDAATCSASCGGNYVPSSWGCYRSDGTEVGSTGNVNNVGTDVSACNGLTQDTAAWNTAVEGTNNGTLSCSPACVTCGPDNGAAFYGAPWNDAPQGLCYTNGVASAAGSSNGQNPNETWTWYCGSQYCSATQVLHGTCGPLNGGSDAGIPWADGNWGNLCAGGSSPGNGGTDGNGNWVWTCTGDHGGTTATCGATCPQSYGTTYGDSADDSGAGGAGADGY
jgi:hypothetical protein